MKNLARKNIQNLKPYEPGKPIEELERELGIKNIIKLASNENPIGASAKALAAMSACFRNVNRYPDGSSFYLRKKIGTKLGFNIDNIIVGCGSDELIDMIIKTFTQERDEVLVTKPAFLEYSILSQARGLKIKEIPIKNFQYDVNAIINAVSKNTKVIFIGNPDNPTGAYMSKKMLDMFIKRCPDNVIAVFDEAYRELVDVKDYSNPIKYAAKKNFIVLRTFSKAYGLAGLRVGYAISNKNIIESMQKIRLPFNVNSIAQRAAEAALDDKAHVAKTARIISDGKRFLAKSLEGLGFKIVVSPANFILVNAGKRTGEEIFKKLLTYGVIVRDMQAYGLKKYFRVNVGTMKENERFIKTLEIITGEKK
ncbi:MAG: histidinol-phosphate transaminase [Candidatus Omnitrophota bacterium]